MEMQKFGVNRDCQNKDDERQERCKTRTMQDKDDARQGR